LKISAQAPCYVWAADALCAAIGADRFEVKCLFAIDAIVVVYSRINSGLMPQWRRSRPSRRPFEGDPSEACCGLMAELDSAIESG
jgi:hypothetical protein